MQNIIIIAILLTVLCSAGFYVYRAKKSGKKCIGCPAGGKCHGGCGCEDKTK